MALRVGGNGGGGYGDGGGGGNQGSGGDCKSRLRLSFHLCRHDPSLARGGVQVNRGIADMSMKQTFQNFLSALPENKTREKQVEWIFKVRHPLYPYA